MAVHVNNIERIVYNPSNPENVKAIALAAQADEQRNATLAVLLATPSSTSGLTQAQKYAIRVELLKSLGVVSPDEED